MSIQHHEENPGQLSLIGSSCISSWLGNARATRGQSGRGWGIDSLKGASRLQQPRFIIWVTLLVIPLSETVWFGGNALERDARTVKGFLR